MASKTMSFYAEAILAHLRAGHRPNEEEAAQLDRLPHIDELRRTVVESDLPWLLGILNEESSCFSGLGCSLLRGFTGRADIQQLLRNRWETANAYLRARLMWRILDDPELEAAWHQKLLDYVLTDWDTFRRVALPFMGTPQNILSQALRRIGDPSFPGTKRWAYLCCALDAEDQQAAKALLTLALNLRDKRDAFTRKVAETLLTQFFPVKV